MTGHREQTRSEVGSAPRRRRGAWIWVALGLWLAATGGGMAMLWQYNATPGESADPPQTWPENSKVKPTPGLATLVMLAHPRCPCTRATISELAALMSRLNGQIHANVLFLRPEGMKEGWERSALWRSARAIPGVTVMVDEGGVEAARFRSRVSGQTVVYDARGRLLFSGGITSARGHEGDNAGRQRIVALVTEGIADRDDSLVYGCELEDEPIAAR